MEIKLQKLLLFKMIRLNNKDFMQKHNLKNDSMIEIEFQ